MQFAATLRWAEKWRDSKIVWLGILGLVVSTILVVNPVAVDAVCQAWLGDGTRLTFGAVWFRWVMRPVFLVFALAWVWRVVVLTLLLRGISKLDLQLVPSHPDRCGGLGFLETLPLMFAPVILAAASVAAGRMAHEVLYHGVHVAELKSQAAVGAIVLVAFFLMPLIVIGAPLRRLRVMGRLDYSKLAGRQARAIHSRWIRGETVQEDGVLSAPELGPAADVATLYTNAASVRSTVIGRVSILAVLAPILLPALIVASLEVPIKQILLKLMGAFT